MPIPGVHGSYDMTLRAIATETENASTSFRDGTIRVIVDAQADTPTIFGGEHDQRGHGDDDRQHHRLCADRHGRLGVHRPDHDLGLPGWLGREFPHDTSKRDDCRQRRRWLHADHRQCRNAANLRTVLDSLRVTPPANSDTDATVTVTARSRDADNSTATQSTSHVITVRAVADTPAATANDVVGNEDTVDRAVALGDQQRRCRWQRVFVGPHSGVPTGTIFNANLAGGGTLTNNNDGTWSITAPTTAQLNTILGSLTFLPPVNLSGTVTMQLEVTSTEAANGGQVLTKTSTVTDSFTVTLTADVADIPLPRVIAATGASGGLEDTPIPNVISADIVDNDGSQVLTYRISDVPAGASFVNAGARLSARWCRPASTASPPPRLPAQDHSAAALQRRLHAAGHDPVDRGGAGQSRQWRLPRGDGPAARAGEGRRRSAGPQRLDRDGRGGCADPAWVHRDRCAGRYRRFRDAVLCHQRAAGGVVPSAGVYIGGEWQIAAADIATVTIPAVPNFSGNYTSTFAPG